MLNGATLGYADKMRAMDAAIANGDLPEGADISDATPYAGYAANERASTDKAARRTGLAGDVAGLVGMMAPAGALGKAVGVAGALAEGVPALGRIAMNPYVQSAATGAGVGGGNAAGHDEDVGQGAAIGAGAGIAGQGLASALRAGLNKVVGVFNKPTIPTTEGLKEAAQNAYQAADNAGVIINSSGTQRLASEIKGEMADFGYSPHMQPMGRGVLDEMGNLDGQNVTLKGLDTFRKVAGRLRESQNPSEQALGIRIVGKIDDFASNLAPSEVMTGDSQAGVGALNDARTLWQRSAKSEALDNTIESARLRAASTGSGGNVDNAIRQNARRLLESGQKWAPDEESALREVVVGTPTQNALRLVGKLSPGGSGLMLALHTGATMTNPVLGIPALAGALSKTAADRMTSASVRRLSELLRSGGDASALNPPTMLTQTQREMLSRGLMGSGVVAADKRAALPANTGSRNARVSGGN
ncbi:MAG: hypothetical protein ACLPSW_29695 [Roseiarcus sp.]